MIEIVDGGDIFALGCEALVNPVNCQGTMGRGVAREVRARYPDCVSAYAMACATGALRPGWGPIIYHRSETAVPRFILHLATKDRWAEPSRLDWIEQGLNGLFSCARALELRDVAVPALGCGLGGLRWADVLALLRRKLDGAATVFKVVPPR